jgi:hypothetical protein
MTNTELKTQIDIQITNETVDFAISPDEVGENMKGIIDYTDQEIATIKNYLVKTNGSVLAVLGSKATLQYDINTVNKSGGSDVKLPTTTEIGKEVLFLASNYSGTVSVYVNDAEDVKLSGGINGISGTQGNLQINANEAYRFIYRTNGYWYFEKIIDIPNNYYQLVSERTTDGTLASNSNFKYPTEQAVKTYVNSNLITKSVKTTLSLSQVQNLFTTPVTILPSTTGFVKKIIGMYVYRNTSDAYTLANDYFDITNSSGSSYGISIPMAIFNFSGAVYANNGISFDTNGSGTIDSDFKLKAKTGNPTGGTGGLDIYVTYIEIKL